MKWLKSLHGLSKIFQVSRNLSFLVDNTGYILIAPPLPLEKFSANALSSGGPKFGQNAFDCNAEGFPVDT